MFDIANADVIAFLSQLGSYGGCEPDPDLCMVSNFYADQLTLIKVNQRFA